MENINAIEIKGLTKSFKGMYALNGLNMTVPVGSIYGFIGENGSGKSTTEKLICGLLVPNSGTIMILAYFIGSLIGGAIAGLNFQLVGFTLTNVIMCLLAKIFLLLVFTAIYLVMSVIGKHKTWLSMVLSLAVSMLLFMMIPSISPLTSTIINVALSLAGGVIFCTGIGAISNAILKKTSLV